MRSRPCAARRQPGGCYRRRGGRADVLERVLQGHPAGGPRSRFAAETTPAHVAAFVWVRVWQTRTSTCVSFRIGWDTARSRTPCGARALPRCVMPRPDCGSEADPRPCSSRRSPCPPTVPSGSLPCSIDPSPQAVSGSTRRFRRRPIARNRIAPDVHHGSKSATAIWPRNSPSITSSTNSVSPKIVGAWYSPAIGPE